MPKSKLPSRRPIMTLLDVLGRRWTLRVLWELRAGPLSFRALRTAADDVSPSVLNARLAELRELGVVEVQDDGYQLTASGVELSKTLLALNAWANQHV
jgi:DNA-binding HxlR family transcriptional regulator